MHTRRTFHANLMAATIISTKRPVMWFVKILNEERK